MKQSLLFTALGSLLCVSGNAQDSEVAKCNKPEPKKQPEKCAQPVPKPVCTQPEPAKECCPTSCCSWSCCCHPCLEYPVSLYETYDNCGIGLGARADVLYMNYTIPVQTVVSLVTDVGTTRDSTIYGPEANPNVGCELALNYTMCGDPGYTFETRWFHIVSKFNRNFTGNLSPAHIVAITGGAPGTASNNAHITFNFFDLVMKKEYRLGKYLTVNPTVGVIGGYMDGKNSASFARTGGSWGAGVVATTLELNQRIKYEGIGMRLGSGFEYEIGWGLKLMGNLYYNALYGFSKNHLNVVANGVVFSGLTGAHSHYTNHHGRTFFDSLLGLSWETSYCNNALWGELHAGWRYQYYGPGWTQFEAELNNALSEHALYGQGLQAGASFKF